MTKQQKDQQVKAQEAAIVNAAKEGTASKAAAKVTEDKPANKKASKDSALYADKVYAALSPKLRKSFRSKTRKNRNKLAKEIISLSGTKDKAAQAEAIKAFNIFYKENYKVNDLSLESLGAKNSDDDTKELISSLLKELAKGMKKKK